MVSLLGINIHRLKDRKVRGIPGPYQGRGTFRPRRTTGTKDANRLSLEIEKGSQRAESWRTTLHPGTRLAAFVVLN